MPYVYTPRSLQDSKLLQVKVMVWTALQLAVAHFKNTLGHESWQGPLSHFHSTTIDQMRRKWELVVSPNVETSLEPASSSTQVSASQVTGPLPPSAQRHTLASSSG